MRFNKLVFKNLVRRPARSLLTVSGIAVAVAAVVALVGISRGFEHSLLKIYKLQKVDLIVSRQGAIQSMASTLDESLGPQIAKLQGVKEVSPGLVDVVSFADYDLIGVVVQGRPVDSFLVNGLKVIKGKNLEPGVENQVILGKVLAQNLGVKIGDPLEVISGFPFTVVGIYDAQNVFENGAVVMKLEEMQKLMDRPGEVSAFVVSTTSHDRAEIEDLCERIKALAPGRLDAKPASDFVDSRREIQMARGVAWLTSTIALVVGTIGMLNTMMTTVFERTREIAVLRAIGWRRKNVMKLILSESVMLGIVGAFVGIILAVVLTQVLSRMPASGNVVSGYIAPAIMLQGFLVALGVGLIGGIYPAYRASLMQPVEALRQE